jgi:hypothetical protein
MDSSVIDSIVMPYSVGVRSAVPFEAALHDPMCRRRIDGRDLATNVYRPFFVKNERIADGSDPRSMKSHCQVPRRKLTLRCFARMWSRPYRCLPLEPASASSGKCP